jgi:hypothetical protein
VSSRNWASGHSKWKQFFRRKLHLSVDSNTHEIRAVVFSKLSLDDAGVVKGTLDQITEAGVVLLGALLAISIVLF